MLANSHLGYVKQNMGPNKHFSFSYFKCCGLCNPIIMIMTRAKVFLDLPSVNDLNGSTVARSVLLLPQVCHFF